MPTTFEVINKTSSAVHEGNEVIAIGFINNSDTPELLNYLQLSMDELTEEETEIAESFINMMRAKVLASGDGTGES